MKITAVIICGGRSSRMGRDKASLPLGHETMLERSVRVAASIASESIVVARAGQVVPGNVRVVRDPIADLGPLAAIAAGLEASKTDLNFVIACDMPFVKPELLLRLVSLIEEYDVCVAVNDGHAAALCGIYRSRVAETAERLLESGERRVMALLDRVNTKRIDGDALRDVDPELESLISCDTPETYARVMERIRT